MAESNHQPFSFNWVIVSVITFLGLQALLGVLLGRYLFRAMGFYSHRYALEGLLHLVSYFAGGILIGVISPRIRILEPAVGAAIAVALVLLLQVFTPYTFFHFSMTKLLIGGGMAFFFALSGAKLGERITGNKV